MNITKEYINNINKNVDIGEIMYRTLLKLCLDYPEHSNNSEIFAKVVVIGRSFQADILRRKNRDETKENEDVYNLFIEALVKSDIDSRINSLKSVKRLQDENDIRQVLELHNNIMRKLHEIVNQSNRSFVSKYLHFHLPHVIFIYDNVARNGLKKIVGNHYTPTRNTFKGKEAQYDSEYTRFLLCNLDLQDYLATEFGMILSPREIDRLLTEKVFHPSNFT